MSRQDKYGNEPSDTDNIFCRECCASTSSLYCITCEELLKRGQLD